MSGEKILLPVLFLLIFVSGCIGNARADSKDDPNAQDPNILVYTIEQVPSSIQQESAGELRIGLIHRGEDIKPAKNVRIEFYNPSDLEIQRVDCTFDQYITKPGDIVQCDAQLNSTGTCGGNEIMGCAASSLAYGDTLTSIFRVTVPPLQEQDLRRRIGYAVSFDYSSKSKLSLPLTTIDRQLSSNPSNAEYKLEKGISPIQPDMSDMRKLVILDQSFEFKLMFNDVGTEGGDVVKKRLPKGSVLVTLPRGFSVATGAGPCDFDYDQSRNILTSSSDYDFVSDKTKAKRCWLVADSSVLGTSERFVDILIDVDEFTYEIDRITSITLAKRK